MPLPSKGPKRLLAGVRILVGRARQQASSLSAGLQALGAEVIEIPLIEIRKPRSYKALDNALGRLSTYDWLILTSVNGVEALVKRIEYLALTKEHFKHLHIAAIGPSTREHIERLGLKVSVVPARYIAESVVESLQGKIEGKQVLLVRARIARDVIPRQLKRMGAHVDTVVAYETVAPASSGARLRSVMADRSQRPHVVTFTSSSTVRNFLALLGPAASSGIGRKLLGDKTLLHGALCASIGPITSATLAECGLAADIEAKDYTVDGLIRAIQAKAGQFCP
ncbi:MAG: uroporphyrinogen-III synthase [Acidobacteria bacterium]|nr:uroporphyrinogen-III synthase [Acidobacteriota bacterium]